MPALFCSATVGCDVSVALALVALCDPERRAVLLRYVQREIADEASLDDLVCHLGLWESEY